MNKTEKLYTYAELQAIQEELNQHVALANEAAKCEDVAGVQDQMYVIKWMTEDLLYNLSWRCSE